MQCVSISRAQAYAKYAVREGHERGSVVTGREKEITEMSASCWVRANESYVVSLTPPCECMRLRARARAVAADVLATNLRRRLKEHRFSAPRPLPHQSLCSTVRVPGARG